MMNVISLVKKFNVIYGGFLVAQTCRQVVYLLFDLLSIYSLADEVYM